MTNGSQRFSSCAASGYAGIRNRSAVIAELETTGSVKIVGAMYNLELLPLDTQAISPRSARPSTIRSRSRVTFVPVLE